MSLSTSAAELKAQGVVEAAQDPNSSVTADDAQQKIVTESKKAGVAAFTFNPDASPEEKAAQARAVCTTNGSLENAPLICIHCRMCQQTFTTNTNPRESQFLQTSMMGNLGLTTFLHLPQRELSQLHLPQTKAEPLLRTVQMATSRRKTLNDGLNAQAGPQDLAMGPQVSRL
jgi:hypothetical protein